MENTTTINAEQVLAEKTEIEDMQAGLAMAKTTPLAEDEAIMEMAKERIERKKKLFYQGLDLLLLALVFGLLVLDDYPGDRVVIAAVAGLFWGGRYLLRLIKFFKPSFKNGIKAYIRDNRQNKLNAEYVRLKKLYDQED